MTGEVVGERYVLEHRIGQGGMGVVWRADDTTLHRAVAVKMLPASMVGDERARGRLLREARAAAALTHANVVQVHDVFEGEDGNVYVVLELVEGRTVAEASRPDRPALKDVLRWIGEAASALDAAHAIGIVHRDVKPDNMMIRRDGRLVLLDFGIAKIAEAAPGDSMLSTRDGAIVGTPGYMSPEQARGQTPGPAGDEWALAVVAYELLTGKSPWSQGALLDTLNEIVSSPHPPPSGVAPLLTPEVDAVFARALAKQPGDRYPTLGAFGAALKQACASISAERIPAASSPESASTGPIAHAETVAAGTLESGASASSRRRAAAPRIVVTPTPASRTPMPATRTPMPASRTPMPTTKTNEHDLPREITPATTRSSKRSTGGALAIVAAVGVASVVALIATVAVPIARRHRGSSSISGASTASASALASPFADPSARVGCVPLVGSGVDRSLLGWYGAAASHAICARIFWFRGATTNTQRVPAQLLHLPPGPVDDFPDDPFGATDARARALATAKKEAAVYVDGTVEQRDDGVHLVADLRDSKDDRSLGHADVHDESVERAAAKLVFSWVDSGALPALPMRPSVLVANDDPRVATLAMTLESDLRELGRADVCQSVRAIDPRLLHAGPFLKSTCDTDPSAPPLAIDRTTPTRFVDSLLGLDRTPHRPKPESVIAELQALVDASKPGDERAFVRGVLGRTMHHSADVTGACTMIRAAISESPAIGALWRDLDERCERTTPVERATSAWAPDFGQYLLSQSYLAPDRTLAIARRRYALAPMEQYEGLRLVRLLTRLGRVEEAAAVVDTLARNPRASRMDRLLGQSYLDLSRGRVSAAHDALMAALLGKATLDSGVDRLASVTAIYCANVLGKTTQTADALITHFDTEAGISTKLAREQLALLAYFTSPGVAKKFLKDVAPRIAGDDDDERSDLRIVAARAAHDRGALEKELRNVEREGQAVTAHAILLDEIGDDELGARVDTATLAVTPKDVAGISMALPRMARRAMRLGQRDDASRLAQQVIDAWTKLDAPSSQVDEMRAIVAGTWIWKAPW